MSIIWIFREQRSGSTAFASLVASRLNKIHKFVRYPEDIEMVKSIPNPEDYVFSTHFYNFIEIMDVFDKPVTLIRCARRDRIERCLSYLIGKHRISKIMKKSNPWNIMRTDSPADYTSFVDALEPTIFTKAEIYNYLQHCTEMNQYWESHAALYQNHTVFYEDLCTDIGVDIPIIDLSSLNITGDDSVTIKMPSYKEQICINHDMVSRWIEEYYSENRI
jgi:hypothetical protein